MSRLVKLQLVGPVLVFLAVLAAESAVYALAYVPTSETLWYLNLRVFGLFQRAHYVISNRVAIDSFQLLFIALPLLAVAAFGAKFKRALPLAIASNLTFVYAAFLVYCWYIFGGASQEASLAVVGGPAVRLPILSSPYVYMMGVLVASSLLSFVMSHISYIRAVRQYHPL
jgi:hypothetical protein